jgi:hypothetical protein
VDWRIALVLVALPTAGLVGMWIAYAVRGSRLKAAQADLRIAEGRLKESQDELVRWKALADVEGLSDAELAERFRAALERWAPDGGGAVVDGGDRGGGDPGG